MKTKFYTALTVIVFITTNFTHYFSGNKLADFMKGFRVV